MSGKRESDLIAEPCRFSESRNYDHVLARTLHPSVKCNHAVLIVHVKCVHVIASQSRLIPPKTCEVLGEAQVICQHLVAALESAELNQLVDTPRIRVPFLP